MSFLKVLQKKSKSSDMHCAPLTNLSEEYGTTIYLSMLYSCCIWVFPKIGGKNPNHPILIGFSIIFTIHFGGLYKIPLFLVETPTLSKCAFCRWRITQLPMLRFSFSDPNRVLFDLKKVTVTFLRGWLSSDILALRLDLSSK